MALPNVFPGFAAIDIVSPSIREIAVAFNAEAVNSLQGIPAESVAWANVCSRVTPAWFEAKIPIDLTALLGFEPFKGERSYATAETGAVAVYPVPFHEGVEWDIRYDQSGNVQLAQFYGLKNFPSNIINHARALKAELAASLIVNGMTNSSLGMTATALTLPQGGRGTLAAYPNGLPLFSDGSTSGASKHFANPIDPLSATFSNLHLNAGKLTDPSVYGQMLVDMQQIPHPTKRNMTLGLGVTDIFGGTGMRNVFQTMAVQTLALQTISTSFGATTNIFTQESMQRAGQQITAAGMSPVRYWICPQLDAHPYLVAHPTYQMWFAVSGTLPGTAWAEFAAPSKDFTPTVTLLGDGSEEARKTRKVRLFADIDAGVAAGLPHFIQAYFETTP